MGISKATASSVAPGAKGDLVVGSATNDAAILTVGTNNHVLTADSATATGLKWAAPAGGVDPTLRPMSSGTWLGALRDRATTFGTSTLNQTSYMPIYLPDCTLDRIGFRSANTFVSAGVTRLGIYNNSSTTNLPSTVLLDAGTVNVTATTTDYEITISQSITKGWYWLAINRQGGDYNAYIVNSTGILSSYPINVNETNSLFDASNGSPNVQGYSQTGVSGAFGTAGTLTRTTSPVTCAVRIA